MPGFSNYDPSKVTVSFKGILVVGYMSGTFVSVDRDDDAYETVAGSQGDVTRVHKLNRAGVATITLQQSSPSNEILRQVHVDDTAESTRGSGVGNLIIKDLNGTTLATADAAWIMKHATIEYSDGLEGREWKIACADLDIVGGGSLS